MRRAILVLALLALPGCDDGGGDCADFADEPERTEFVPTGTYDGAGTCEPEFCDLPFGPREGAENFTLEVDRDARLVWIRFTRNGVAVEERWRITGHEVN